MTAFLRLHLSSKAWGKGLAAVPVLLSIGCGYSLLSGAGQGEVGVVPWAASAGLLMLAGFLGLRPQLPRYPILYLLGSLVVMLGFVGFWVVSPVGWRWVQTHIPGAPPMYSQEGAVWFSVLQVSFPVAWLFIAGSVGQLKRGLALYLGVGIVVAWWFVGTGLGSGASRDQALGLGAYLFVLWPNFCARGTRRNARALRPHLRLSPRPMPN